MEEAGSVCGSMAGPLPDIGDIPKMPYVRSGEGSTSLATAEATDSPTPTNTGS